MTYKKTPSIKSQLDKAEKKALQKRIDERINWNFSHISPAGRKELDKALLAEAKRQGAVIEESQESKVPWYDNVSKEKLRDTIAEVFKDYKDPTEGMTLAQKIEFDKAMKKVALEPGAWDLDTKE